MISSSDIFYIDEDRHIPNYQIITYTNEGLYLYNIDYMSNSDGKSDTYKVNIEYLN